MEENEVLRQLSERKSVRAFLDREIPEAAVEAILTAASNAPTAGNQQLYTILRITDPALKAALSESCDHQPFIAKAPLVLVFCADCKKWYDAYRSVGCKARRPGVGDLLLAVDDALVAAQNAVTAAWSLGVGSCFIGDVMENMETQRSLLRLPEYVFPAAMLVFGYPTEQQQNRPKPPRAALEYLVQENTYAPLSDDALRKMLLKNCTEETFDHWLRAFHARKYDSDFAREMTRSVAAFLRQFERGDEHADPV